MTELLVLEQLNPITVFTENGLDNIIDKIEAEVKSIATDPTTKKGRDEIASLAYKVARSKTTLDEMGKALTEDWKKKSAAVDQERKRMRERMDRIKDEVRQPLTDYENLEKSRVAALQNRLNEIEQLITVGGNTQDELKERLVHAEAINLSDWQEFTGLAAAAKQKLVSHLQTELQTRIKYDADQAELEQLRQEQQKRREEEIAAQAAAEANARAEKAEQDRIAAEKKAQEDAKLAEEKRIKGIAEAEQRERDRIAAEQDKQKAEAAAREADKENKTRVNDEILVALTNIDTFTDVELAKKVITAIARGQIPNVKIIY